MMVEQSAKRDSKVFCSSETFRQYFNKRENRFFLTLTYLFIFQKRPEPPVVPTIASTRKRREMASVNYAEMNAEGEGR